MPQHVSTPDDDEPFYPRPTEPDIVQQSKELLCYLWDNYLQINESASITLMGVGDAYLGIKQLLTSRGTFPLPSPLPDSYLHLLSRRQIPHPRHPLLRNRLPTARTLRNRPLPLRLVQTKQPHLRLLRPFLLERRRKREESKEESLWEREKE